MRKYKILTYAVLVIAAALLAAGIIAGDPAQVMRKAALICFECIGIG